MDTKAPDREKDGTMALSAAYDVLNRHAHLTADASLQSAAANVSLAMGVATGPGRRQNDKRPKRSGMEAFGGTIYPLITNCRARVCHRKTRKEFVTTPINTVYY